MQSILSSSSIDRSLSKPEATLLKYWLNILHTTRGSLTIESFTFRLITSSEDFTLLVTNGLIVSQNLFVRPVCLTVTVLHLSSKYFRMEAVLTFVVRFRIFLYESHSFRVLPYLKNLFLAMDFEWVIFRNSEFINGTGLFTGFLVLRGACSSTTSQISLLVYQNLSLKSSKISPTWYGALEISFLKLVKSNVLYERYEITFFLFRGTWILLLKQIILWKSPNPTSMFSVSAILLWFVANTKSSKVGLLDLKHVGSDITFVRPCVSITSNKHLESCWHKTLMFRSPTTKTVENCSDWTVSSMASIESQHCDLNLLFGLYRHMNNHFSFLIISSIIMASTGFSDTCSRSDRLRWGRSFLT